MAVKTTIAHMRKEAQTRPADSKLLRIIMMIALIIGLFPTVMIGFAASAYADDTAYLNVGHTIEYAGYSTNYFDVDGNVAYCGQPSKATPASGNYTKSAIQTSGNVGGFSASQAYVALALYYSYGGPGFTPSMWPSSWYDGSGMSADRYMALGHILIADICYYDSAAALRGCDSAFKSWCTTNVLGGANSGITPSAGSTKAKMIDAYTSNGGVIQSFVGKCYMLTTGSSTQTILYCSPIQYGSLDLYKSSSNTSITNGNSCYSLAGAKYQVTGAGGSWTVTTDGSGYAHLDNIPAGSYTITETSPAKGYGLGAGANITISGGNTSTVRVTDPPQNDPPAMILGKFDGEKNYNGAGNLPQGSASLAGAEYTVKYYAGYYTTAAAAQSSGTLKRTWVFRTDSDGFADFTSAYKVRGDDFYYASDGTPSVPLGTVTIQETKAPEGYLLSDTTVYVRQVTSAGQIEFVSTYNAPQSPEQVIRGGVRIEKRDLESGLLTPLGGATLEGTKFEIVNKSANAVMVDGVSHEPDTVVKTISIENGVAETADDALPYGKYVIRESAPSVGYLHTDKSERAFSITQDKVIVDLLDDDAARNQVKRGDLEFVKVRESDQKRLSGVPFVITSNTTGESHILVTDENGEAKTASSWNAHTDKTNANDAAVSNTGDLDEGALDAYAGIWFGKTTEGTTVKADDTLGALPYDTYTLQELKCSQNKGLDMVNMTVTVSRDSNSINLGSIDDQPAGNIYLSTVARDAHDGDKTLFCDPQSAIIDRVEFMGVNPEQAYKMRMTLADAETGDELTDSAGNVLTASKLFTSPTANGWIELTVPFDSREHAGKDIVVYEEILDPDKDEVLSEHKDTADFDQTVHVAPPTIGTTATDGYDGDKNVANVGTTWIKDVIAYTNLVDGAEYTAVGTLMVKTEAGIMPLTDSNGLEMTSTVNFTPIKPEGDVLVEFKFDGLLTDDLDIVVYETVLRDGKVIATHEDPDDASQTVTVVDPEIRTTATDAFDGDDEVAAIGVIKIDDTVHYTGLVAGLEYELHGTLMTVKDGKVTPLLDKSGAKITASVSFTPDAAEGDAIVTFEANADLDAGQKVVVYESLLRDELLLASHEDPTDESQTVTAVKPAIGTTAVDGLDGDKNVVASAGAQVVDSIAYEGLIAGYEYTAVGMIMELPNPAANVDGDDLDALRVDPKDAAPLLDANGNPISASATFTPANKKGTADVTFDLDASLLAGKRFVVYEKLYLGDTLVGTHEDPNDADQRFYVVSTSFSTEALSAEEEHYILTDAEALVNDFVYTSNVKPGEEYTAYGLLFDPETGDPIVPGGMDPSELDGFMRSWWKAFGIDEKYDISKGTWNEFPKTVDKAALDKLLAGETFSKLASASTTFIPDASNGKASMTYDFDARSLDGVAVTSIVMLVNSADVLVAAETDLFCDAQTVALTDSKIGTVAVDATDGDHEALPSRLTNIDDTVHYEGLKPGREYTIKGFLMDKDTEKVVMVADRLVEGEAKFVPSAASGEAHVQFVFDSSNLAGSSLVAYEYLYLDMITEDGRSEQVLVADHADITDEDQTVRISGTPIDEAYLAELYDKTGTDAAKTVRTAEGFGIAGLLTLAACAMTRFFGAGRRETYPIYKPFLVDEGDTVSAKSTLEAKIARAGHAKH